MTDIESGWPAHSSAKAPTRSERVRMARKLSLPWPPSVNHYLGKRVAATTAGKSFVQVYETRRAKDYKLEVRSIVGVVHPFEGPVRIDLVLYPPDRRCRDIDNICKVLFDSLETAKVVVNDSQFRHAGSWEWCEPVPGGRVDIELTEIATAQQALGLTLGD